MNYIIIIRKENVMKYKLRETATASEAEFPTEVEITEKDGRITFSFTCEGSKHFCPYKGEYNRLHCDGDVCEVFIGSDPERKEYYEMELSPNNDLMLAKIRYSGDDEDGVPILDIGYVDECFVKTEATVTENGYVCSLTFDLKDVMTGDGEMFFNCYRIETQGGTPNRRLFALSPTMRRRFHTPKYYVQLNDYIGEKK